MTQHTTGNRKEVRGESKDFILVSAALSKAGYDRATALSILQEKEEAYNKARELLASTTKAYHQARYDMDNLAGLIFLDRR